MTVDQALETQYNTFRLINQDWREIREVYCTTKRLSKEMLDRRNRLKMLLDRIDEKHTDDMQLCYLGRKCYGRQNIESHKQWEKIN